MDIRTVIPFVIAVKATAKISFARSAGAKNHLPVNAGVEAVSVNFTNVTAPPGPACRTRHVYHCWAALDSSAANHPAAKISNTVKAILLAIIIAS
jgi:hypothetical protein